MSKNSRKKKSNKKTTSIAMAVICIAVVVFFIGSFISKQVTINRKQAELDRINAEITAQNLENEELSAVIEKGDDDEQIEKYARQAGYVYPDERVFVDVTPGSSK